MSETTPNEHEKGVSTDGNEAAVRTNDSNKASTRHTVAITENSTTTIKHHHEHTLESAWNVLVAIPAYNEESTISGIVRQACEYTDHVLVVNDGSDDDTGDRAAAAGAIVTDHKRNRGYGAALKTAFAVAQHYDVAHLIVLDGDGQHDPADVPQLVETQETTGAHLVIGSRFVDGATSNAPLYRRIGLRTVNALTNLSMGVVRAASRVSDTQSGFRAYDREAIATLAEDVSIGNWMDASTDILYHAHQYGYDIEEVPITVRYDVEDPSSQTPISHGIVLVRNILKTVERERPLTALALPGFLLVFSGLGVGYRTTTLYIQSGTFSVGLALLAAFLVIIGLFACFTALVLHSLSTYFENTGRERVSR